MATPTKDSWEAVLAAGVKAQRLVPGAIAVGGTAAALYAQHRLSQDTDHLLPSLAAHFDDVRSRLEAAPEWKTARVQAPVLILGSIDGVQVGFRQSRRIGPIESIVVETTHGPLAVPTLDELMGMKAYLAYSRGALRDFLDFAALSHCTDAESVVATLLKSDERYGHLQTTSVALAIAKALADPRPFDLKQVRLDEYKGLEPQWQDWTKVRDICVHLGERLGKRLILDSGRSCDTDT